MKIAIASEGETEESEVSPRGARAPFYLVYENGKFIETIKNPFAVGGGGAGWSAAHMLAKKGITMFITGRIGPNMETALKEKSIEFKEVQGKKVKEVIKNLNNKN